MPGRSGRRASQVRPATAGPESTGLSALTAEASSRQAVPVSAQVTGREGIGLVEAARLPPAEVLTRLGSSVDGLSADEARRRLAEYGPNAIRSHGVRPLSILWRQLRNPLLILLAAATITSLVVGERTDAIIILAIVVLSVGLGFFNEYRSERVVEALHSSIR